MKHISNPIIDMVLCLEARRLGRGCGLDVEQSGITPAHGVSCPFLNIRTMVAIVMVDISYHQEPSRSRHWSSGGHAAM